MSSRIYTLLLFVIAAMNCSANMLIPVRHNQYERIQNRDNIYVYMKNGDRRFLTNCRMQDHALEGTQYLNYPVAKKKAIISVDSISFIMVMRKNYSNIVPINPIPADSLDKFSKIYIVLKNGELVEIKNPIIEGDILREGQRNGGQGQRYAGFHLDSIRTFAVEGVLDPWGKAVSFAEMDRLSPRHNRQNSALFYGLLMGLAAIIPAAGVSAIMTEGTITGDLITLIFWSGFTYSGYMEGMREGTKLDHNVALEKILRNRAKAREVSCSQRE